jgi:hypothetical protein
VDVPPDLSPADRQQLAALGRVIDEAQKQLRGGDVDPKLLKDLGMTQPQFKTFVEKYTQRLERVKDDRGDVSGGPVEGRQDGPGGRTAQAGKTLDQQLLEVRGGEKLTPDQIRQLYESRSAKISPEYRKQVEDYFRAISEGGAGSPPPTPAPTSGPAR